MDTLYRPQPVEGKCIVKLWITRNAVFNVLAELSPLRLVGTEESCRQ